MHAQIERRTLRFPGANLAGTVVYDNIPGPALDGGAVAPSGDRTALTTSTYLPINTAVQSYQKISLVGGGGPVVGIGIAPDSAIHTADIALVGLDGELQRHRISPGNPLLGCQELHDFAYISIPNGYPGVTENATIVHWDTVPSTGESAAQVPGFPLRLELYRGCILPMRSPKRAGYFAHAIYEIAAAASRQLRVCVDGRRRIDVAVFTSAGTCTISALSVETRKVAAKPLYDAAFNITLPLDNAGTLTQAVTNTTPFCFSFDGNPMTMLNLVLDQTVATGIVQVKVKAWD